MPSAASRCCTCAHLPSLHARDASAVPQVPEYPLRPARTVLRFVRHPGRSASALHCWTVAVGPGACAVRCGAVTFRAVLCDECIAAQSRTLSQIKNQLSLQHACAHVCSAQRAPLSDPGQVQRTGHRLTTRSATAADAGDCGTWCTELLFYKTRFYKVNGVFYMS